jgi:hypothetical protein
MVVDRSGSMRELREEAQNGLRAYMKEQSALPGKATLSLYEFDDKHVKVHDFAPLSAAAAYELLPRGWTALLDALGHAITEVGEVLAAMPEQDRPGKVIVVTTTDGLENFSTEYTLEQVRDLIGQQHRVWKWEFIYLGANQDAFQVAGGMGMQGDSAMDYAATPAGMASAYRGASAASARYVSGQSASTAFTVEEREEAKGTK